jgi:hypothetical protein
MRARIVFLVIVFLFLAVALTGIISAAVLANIKITATFYNYTSGTTYDADFHLKVIDKANDGFDNSDFVLQKLPDGGGYSVLYSNITEGYSLAIDSYNGTSSRKIKLVYSIVPADTGVVNLSWHVSGKKFKAKLRDYAHDNTYTNPIASLDMMTTSEYSAVQPFSDGFRYFGIDSLNSPIQIFFTDPTLANNALVSNTNYELRINMTNASLSEFVFDWDGTNYSIYDDSLVLMMNFDNLSALGENDTFVSDLSDHGNDGIAINGAAPNSSGKYNGAYSFDGINDFINVSKNASLSPAKVTVSAWINANTWNTGFINQIVGNEGNTILSNFILRQQSGTLTMYCWVGGAWYNAAWAGTPSTGVWHHVVGTYDGETIRLYVDSIEKANNTSPSGDLGICDRELTIGNWWGGGRAFNGSIDEVRIYNRSLSADEVKQIYYSNLQKYDEDKWSFYANEQNLESGIYHYRGSALDAYNGWNSTEERNVTIESDIVAISLNVSLVEFGNITHGGNYTNLTGIRIQNDGNTYLNVNVNSSDFFLGSHGWPGNNYLFRTGNAGEGNETNGVYNSSSLISWTQMSNLPKTAIYHLNWTNSSDLAAIQFNISVPMDEPAGARESIIYIVASQA